MAVAIVVRSLKIVEKAINKFIKATSNIKQSRKTDS